MARLTANEPAALIGVLATFIVGGLQALGANGTVSVDVANALSILVPVLAGIVTRQIVYSPATVAAITASGDAGTTKP